MGAEILIAQAGSEQFEPALEFVQAAYQKKYGTLPSSIWKDCLVASAGCHIVGVMAMQFSEGEPFSVENHFLFDFSTLAHPRREFVSFGRWVAEKPGVGMALMCAAVQSALMRGRSRSISCSKKRVMEFLRRSGLRFDTLCYRILPESVAPEDRAFFLEEPAPCLCVWELQQWYDCLSARVPASIAIVL